MKILIVAHEAEFTGGANRSLIMVIEKLKKIYNVDIEVLLPSKKGKFNSKLDELNIIWHYFLPYFGVISSIRNDGKDILRIIKVYIGYLIEHIISILAMHKFKNSNFDAVYTNTRLPIVGALIAKKLNIPHICHVREFGAEKPLWGWWRHKDINRLSNKIICISKALSDTFVNYAPAHKITTIYNGIDSPLDIKYTIDTKKTKLDLILTGRIVPDKGQDEAIEAMKILIEKGYKDIILHIVGSSPKRTHIDWYERKLKKIVNDYNINENVIFHGEIEDMLSIRAKMDIELMCAIKETFGRVTVEGMRSGLAVIGSNTGGTLEIIEDNYTGLLYQQGSPEDLAKKIELLYKNRQKMKKLAQNGYNFAQRNFTPDENVNQIYKCIKNTIENK